MAPYRKLAVHWVNLLTRYTTLCLICTMLERLKCECNANVVYIVHNLHTNKVATANNVCMLLKVAIATRLRSPGSSCIPVAKDN